VVYSGRGGCLLGTVLAIGGCWSFTLSVAAAEQSAIYLSSMVTLLEVLTMAHTQQYSNLITSRHVEIFWIRLGNRAAPYLSKSTVKGDGRVSDVIFRGVMRRQIWQWVAGYWRSPLPYPLVMDHGVYISDTPAEQPVG
jgi:hypothetical protein